MNTSDNFSSSPDESPDALVGLLGAYALNALDAQERIGIEARLDADPRARAEADELSQIAALLGSDIQSNNDLPSGAWDRFAPLLDQPATQAPVFDLSYRRTRRLRQMAMGTVAAAFVALFIVVASQRHQISNLRETAGSVTKAAESALTSPGSKHGNLKPSAGGALVSITVLPDGSGFVGLDSLPKLDAQHVWQLWNIDSKNVISLGISGDPTSPMAFHAAPGSHSFAVTLEPVGGSIKATTSPIAAGSID